LLIFIHWSLWPVFCDVFQKKEKKKKVLFKVIENYWGSSGNICSNIIFIYISVEHGCFLYDVNIDIPDWKPTQVKFFLFDPKYEIGE
jgi:hypothetical protein